MRIAVGFQQADRINACCPLLSSVNCSVLKTVINVIFRTSVKGYTGRANFLHLACTYIHRHNYFKRQKNFCNFSPLIFCSVQNYSDLWRSQSAALQGMLIMQLIPVSPAFNLGYCFIIILCDGEIWIVWINHFSWFLAGKVFFLTIL